MDLLMLAIARCCFLFARALVPLPPSAVILAEGNLKDDRAATAIMVVLVFFASEKTPKNRYESRSMSQDRSSGLY